MTQKKHGDRKNHIKPKQVVIFEEPKIAVVEQPVVVEQKVEEPATIVEEDGDLSDESSGIDNEEEGGYWVTPDNLHKHIGSAVTVPDEVKPKEPVDDGNPRFVQFITSDYAMQNVIIQLGFKLLSLDGRRITRVKRFKLLCRACQ